MPIRNLVLVTLSLLLLAALPGVSQQARRLAGKTIYGVIVGTNPQQRAAQVAFYVHVANPDAPGKIPDAMAQQAATLTTSAANLERQGKAEQARRLRQNAEELLHWRQLDMTVDGKSVPLFKYQRSPLAQLAVGDRVRFAAAIEGNASRGANPTRVTAVRDLQQVGAKMPSKINARTSPPNARIQATFYEIIGQVTNTNPLTLDVNGTAIQVDARPQIGYIHQEAMRIGDLQPGQRILARVQMRGEQEVSLVNRLIVLVNNDIPIGPEDDADL